MLKTTITPYPNNVHKKVYLESGSGYYATAGTIVPIKWQKGASNNNFKFTLEDGTKHTVTGKVVKNRLYVDKTSMPKEKVSSLRLTNTGKATEEIKLTLFRVGIPEIAPDQNPYSLVDEDLTTFYNCTKSDLNTIVPLPEHTTKILVLGTADTSINGNTGSQRSPHIREYDVPAGVKKVNLYAPQDHGKNVYEVIFLHE